MVHYGLNQLMSKQRPSKSTRQGAQAQSYTQRRVGKLHALTRPVPPHPSPLPPGEGAWQSRVFKNSFTRKGRRFRVKRWSVKIQFQGQRRSFSLAGTGREAAALEAEAIHNTI